MTNKKSTQNSSQKHDVSDNLSTDDKKFNSRLQETPIAIIGMASVFANAKNLEQYWDNIFEAVDSIIDVPESRWAIDDYYSEDKKAADKTYCKRGGFIPELDFDPMEFGLPPNIVELTDIAQLLSLVVARDVLNDAGIGEGSDYDRDKIGITLGVGGGQKQITPLTSRLQGPVLDKVLKASGIDDEDRAIIIDKFKKAYIGWEENSFPGMLGNVIAGRIANRFDFGGTNCVVDAACAGSLAAIKLAVSDLLEYRSEVMISGGVCCDNSPFMYMSFSKTPAFTTNDDVRPFDEDSKGMMVGEGIGMMAFKRLEDAERDGDRIYAVLKGIGTSSDGRFKSIYAPRPDGQAKALNRAYLDAGFAPETCGLIEAHGTGTLAGDAAEFAGLTKHFSHKNEQRHIALGSVKSQIGHTKSAAGSAGMIKTILALHHKVLPPTINIDQPGSTLDIENTSLYLNSETRPWLSREDSIPRRAGVSSFGFGGTNYHIVLEEYQPKQQGHYRLNIVSQTLLITADDEKALISELTSWREKLSVDEDDQPYVFNSLVTSCPLKTPAKSLARCGFTAKNAIDAISMIDNALKQFASRTGESEWTIPTGIYYRDSSIEQAGKVVALFSGQGSQYVNMGSELVCNFPSIMETTVEMDKQFSKAGLGQLSSITYPIPVFTKDDKNTQEETLRLTQHAQPAIGTLSMSLYKAFLQAGFRADFTAGHSFGELTALWAAGVFSDSDYRMLAMSRGQAMKASDAAIDSGAMIAVIGDSVKIAQEIKAIEGISIANYNSNHQVVVAGVTSKVMDAMAQLKANGYKVIQLPVSAAFHTPLVSHAQKPFAKAIDSAKFNKPSIPVYSNATGLAHSNKPSEIKKSLKNHVLESVYFKDEIDNLYANGARYFIEFGPKHVLTKLVENILADKTDVTAIAVNANPNKSADLQMRQAALQMAVLGIELDAIDNHSAIKRPITAPKTSPMMMKLSAASYVSDKTRKAFDDALTDGWQVKQASGAITSAEPVVKQVIVEKIVEKIVYVTDPAMATAASSDSMESIERSVSQFVEHQQQLLDVHQQFMEGPKDYAKTVDSVLQNQSAATELPESIERTLGMYHQFQSETMRVHEQYLNNQTDNMSSMLGSDNSVVTPVIVVAKPVAATAIPEHVVDVVSPTPVVIATVTAEPTLETSTTPQVDLEKIQSTMMEVVADKTGYPAEMLELEMDMEADLGIDSIKRVEILGAVQELIPDLPELNPEDLAELRTLGEIVDYMKSKAQAVSPATPSLSVVATTTIDLEKIQTTMMEVVADKTGYPAEMLELDMDMEADLGIDSIKRVEILGAVQELIPDLPELNPEDLAELRTLGEIVDYMKSKAQAIAGIPAPELSVVATTEDVSPTTEIDLDMIQSTMMQVVADKTGYPPEMLELEMDMEADLGIDSIKRVEILGAVQELIPDLPELNPEDLAELRTLGEIVDYMKSKATPVAAPALTAIETPATTTVNPDTFTEKLMSVVAEKTGYPSEMLELDMDMEADLGIDSIKRVEILGAVQDAIEGLPEVEPETLAEMRTLGEIVDIFSAETDSSAESESNSEITIEPAPSATVVIKRLSSVNRIKQDSNGANLLIVDDGTGSAVKVASDLSKEGWNVTAIKPDWVKGSSKKAFPKAVSVSNINTVNDVEVEKIIDGCGPLSTVIYMHPKTSIDAIEYPDASKQGLMLAFLLAKHCGIGSNNSELAGRPTFMVISRQGGTLGVDNRELDTDLIQAGLNGLVKTLSHEWPTVFCRTVDVSSKFGADRVASIVTDELLDADEQLVEVAVDKKGRLTLSAEVTDSYNLTAGNSIDSESVFLVSGGAKGVTAHCVIRLAKQYQSRFILLGRSHYEKGEPLWANGVTEEAALKKAAMQHIIDNGEKPTPATITQSVKPIIANREITQTIDAIEAAGAQVSYVSADVTDSEAVQQATKESIAKFGDVTGIIHGAGVLADKFIEQKTLTEFEAVYRTKIDGLTSLLSCTDQQSLKHLVLFSSAAGFYGNPGQSDYSIANEILNKTAFRFKALHPQAQVLSFNWGPWDGGMVTAELKRMFNERGVYIIPLDAGADLLLNELAADTNRCPQILVGNDLSSDQTNEVEGSPEKKLQKVV